VKVAVLQGASVEETQGAEGCLQRVGRPNRDSPIRASAVTDGSRPCDQARLATWALIWSDGAKP
jgi:hypothetical protein